MGIEIIGISVIKNEDIYVEQALTNVIDFCDKILVFDNYSTDKTLEAVKRVKSKYPNKINISFFKEISKTHSFVEKYAGKDKWIFGVDGDELYDPVGLSKLRSQILNREHQHVWMLRGYFLHVIKVNWETKIARGYLAPPSKDPNKLYNFSMLKSWKSDGVGPVFHPQTHVFKDPSFTPEKKPKKKYLTKHVKWKNCILRCVHTRLLQRSSKEIFTSKVNKRLNLSNVISNKRKNPRKKYRIGRRLRKDISGFLMLERD